MRPMVSRMPPAAEATRAVVSLGTYSDRADAEKRVADLRAYAVNPQVVEQPRAETLWWIDVDLGTGAPPIDVSALERAVEGAQGLVGETCPAVSPPEGAPAVPAPANSAAPPAGPAAAARPFQLQLWPLPSSQAQFLHPALQPGPSPAPLEKPPRQRKTLSSPSTIGPRAVTSAKYLRDLIRAYDGYVHVGSCCERNVVTVQTESNGEMCDLLTLHCDDQKDTLDAFFECVKAYE